MKNESVLARAKAESPQFYRYCEYMLDECPDITLPVLRELFKYNATASEYRASLERVRTGGRP